MSNKNRTTKNIKKKLSIFLTIAGPAIVFIYLTFDHFGIIDKISNQNIIDIAITRLEVAKGYPSSFIFEDSTKKEHFEILLNFIKKNTKSERTLEILEEGYRPYLIAPAGEPIKLEGVVESWPIENRRFYSDNHPILLIFKYKPKDKAIRVCSIGELKKWAINRKMNFLYIFGGLGITLFTIAIALLQQRID